MSLKTLLIDTNVIIHLEDNKTVQPVFSSLIRLAAKHNVSIFVHEAAYDDIERDRDFVRKEISKSKVRKFQILQKVRGLNKDNLEDFFGSLNKSNDLVDATVLHSLIINAIDFVISEDRGLHERAKRYSEDLARRVLFVADAVQLLQITFEPLQFPIRFIDEVSAHTIPLHDSIFDSLRDGYPEFDEWWKDTCVPQHRPCWIIEDDGIAAILVRKDENEASTDATQKFPKILKICTFKVRPDKRGQKIGELFLKKAFWFAQLNNYNLVYITTFESQAALIQLLESFGFKHTNTKPNGERIYEKTFLQGVLLKGESLDSFDFHRKHYPRFIVNDNTTAFIVPIKERYHDVLYPDLRQQYDLFEGHGPGNSLKAPGNTIRKVYLCRSKSNLGNPGSLLFFYKGKSVVAPSQSITAIGVLEDIRQVTSSSELIHMTGRRSVYSEKDLEQWQASQSNPVKLIDFYFVAYSDPPIPIKKLRSLGVFGTNPVQSISRISVAQTRQLLEIFNLGFPI